MPDLQTPANPSTPSGVFRLLRNPLFHGMRRVNLMLGAWSILVFLFLYIPIGVLILYSFNSSNYRVKWEGFTGKWYHAFYCGCVLEARNKIGEPHNPLTQSLASTLDYIGADTAKEVLAKIPPRVSEQIRPMVESFFNSILIGLISTVLSVILGTISAWLGFKYRYPLHTAFNTLIAVPMIVPEIIMGVSLLMFYSLLFRLTEGAGTYLLANFLHIHEILASIGIFNMGLGYLTVIISHVTFSFPFVMITIQARLHGLDPSLEEAAMDLGATPAQAFRLVLVPYLLPAIVSGALMAFTLSLDDFVVTYFSASAESRTLPLFMYGATKGPPGMLHVLSTVMIVTTILLVILAELFKGKSPANT